MALARQHIENVLYRLYGLSDFETRRRMPYEHAFYNLAGIAWLLDRLGHPEKQLRAIHIAGTKGKGTTLFYVEQLLMSQGKRVASYSSPHIFDIRERFKCDGEVMTWEQVIPVLERVLDILDLPSGHPHVTLFDVWTATAFLLFASMDLDVAIIETGLGGRWDSTNILQHDNLLAVLLTRIDYDHMDKLGTTLGAIAEEKAEIIKPGIPVFYLAAETMVASPPSPAAHEVFQVFEEKAALEHAPITAVAPHCLRIEKAVTLLHLSDDRLWLPKLFHENLSLALRAVETVTREAISTETLQLILKRERPLGRCTRLRQDGAKKKYDRGNVIVDGAHTVLSLTKLIAEIKQAPFYHDFSSVTFGFYAFFDKPIEDLVAVIPHEWDFVFCHITLPFVNEQRRLKVCERAHRARRERGASFRQCQALDTLKAHTRAHELFVFAGSFKIVAAVCHELFGQASVFPEEQKLRGRH